MDAPTAPTKPSLVGWLKQRTTISGFLLLLLGAVGIYVGFLDIETATLVVTLGLTALVPEDMPIARKALSTIAPILVQQIGHHHVSQKDEKRPF